MATHPETVPFGISGKRRREALAWRAFARGASERRHENLWNLYQPLVRYIAERFNARQHNVHDLADLIDAGNVGLLDAIAEYRFGTETRFEILAVPSIRAAIVRAISLQQAQTARHCLRLVLAEAIAAKEPIQANTEQSEFTLQRELARMMGQPAMSASSK